VEDRGQGACKMRGNVQGDSVEGETLDTQDDVFDNASQCLYL